MRPALWLAAMLAAGIAAAEWLRPHPLAALVAVGACALWAALDRSGRRGMAALALTVVCLGSLRFAYAQTAGRGNLSAWAGQTVSLQGTVVSEPELRKPSGVGYVIAVEGVGNQSARGRLYVTQRGGTAPGFGTRVEFRARLKAPPGPRYPGAFDRAAYLARQGVYLEVAAADVRQMGPGRLSWFRRSAVLTRIRLEQVLKATMPEREAALMAGLLFGSRGDLPGDIKEAFRESGVFHLLAVSGGNLAMVVLPFLALLRRMGVSRRWAAGMAVPLVIFFVTLTGASPSVLRAGLMAMLLLLGDLLRRERDAVNTLGASVSLLLLVQPGLLFDLGFLLSVQATLGILLFARPLEHGIKPHLTRWLGERAGPWLAAGLSVTLAAQILVEPISLYAFGAFSAIAPLANLVVLLFLEPLVQIGLSAVLVGLVLEPVAWLINWLVRLGLWLLVSLVKLMAAVPGAYLEPGHLPMAGALLWYGIVVVAAVPAFRQRLIRLYRHSPDWRRKNGPGLRIRLAALAALALCTPLTWRLALADPPDLLSIHFIDIGQGDAILILAPGGIAALIDAGPYIPPQVNQGRRGYDAGTDVILPYLASRGVDRLDYLVLTHPDQDHAGGGAAILRGIPVGAVLKSDTGATEQRYLEALAVAKVKGARIYAPTAGQAIHLGPEVLLEILNPQPVKFLRTRSDDNSNCLAFRLVYRRVAALFACDIEGEVEERLAGDGLRLHADLLKVSHHGSRHSTTERFLKAVRPRWAVISAGSANRFGHPHTETLQRLNAAGVQVWRTDRHGSITARTDGFTFKLSGARGQPRDDQVHAVGLFGRPWLRAW